MTFLPIAQRELRVASRRPSTHRIRCRTALLAIGASLIAAVAGTPLPGAGSVVNPLFGVQTACAFGLSLLAGVFLTSDCLSEEKREGTLGLLLLTDLKSHDVVLGKFVATSLNGLYCLLGLLPVLAAPLLLGGVTLGEFWRMALALVKDYARALGSTLALVAVTAAGLPALAALGAGLHLAAGWFCFTLASPFHPFARAGETAYVTHRATFWVTLFLSHLLGWCFLDLASVALGQLWPKGKAWSLGRRFGPPAQSSRGGPNQRRRRCARTLPFDPVQCLTGDGAMLRWMAWVIVAGWALVMSEGRLWLSQPMLFYPGAKTFAFLLKTLVGFQACRFFVETRRNGSLELLLCSPLRNADLIEAQWRALRRIFMWPLVVFLLLSVVNVVSPLPLPPQTWRADRRRPSLRDGFPGNRLPHRWLVCGHPGGGLVRHVAGLDDKKAGTGAGTHGPVCPYSPLLPLPAGPRRGHAFRVLGHHPIAAGLSLARARSGSAGPLRSA